VVLLGIVGEGPYYKMLLRALELAIFSVRANIKTNRHEKVGCQEYLQFMFIENV